MTETVPGGWAYGYLFMSQHKDAPQVFKALLTEVRPARILEIGTFHGGLTLLLRDIMDELNLQNNIIRTYDINDQEFLKPLVKDRAVDVRTVNVFDYENNTFIDNEAASDVSSFIQQDGVSMILCDGGCKKCEYNTIAPLLKDGDIIMAHDYAPSQKYFEEYVENKIWNWLEISDQDIQKTSDAYKLQPYYQELLQQIAWLCRRKNV